MYTALCCNLYHSDRLQLEALHGMNTDKLKWIQININVCAHSQAFHTHTCVGGVQGRRNERKLTSSTCAVGHDICKKYVKNGKVWIPPPPPLSWLVVLSSSMSSPGPVICTCSRLSPHLRDHGHCEHVYPARLVNQCFSFFSDTHLKALS